LIGKFYALLAFRSNKIKLAMKKVKLIDLFGIKYDQMETRINNELEVIQSIGGDFLDVKLIGDKLIQCSVFVYFEE
jgi:hypothetical protein